MKQTITPPQYLQIALDLAHRIVRGDFAEGSRIYGRSVLASEYEVSPETIRRALRLLGDMKVVEIIPQSGVVVRSMDSAKRYIAQFDEGAKTDALRTELQDLFAQSAAIHQRMGALVAVLTDKRYTVAASQEALANYEVTVPCSSPLIGKSIGALHFWQSTGSTIVALRRGSRVILSPGPYAELYAGDVIILVGTPNAAAAALQLVTNTEGSATFDSV